MFMQWKRMAAPLSAVMLLGALYSAGPAAAAGPEAEKLPEWAAAELTYWQSAGLLQGNEKGELLPAQQVTRAELAAMLDRIFQFNARSEASFTDVPANAWYADNVSKAAAAGIIKGTGDGRFQPQSIVTRQEAATMAARAFQVSQESASAAPFADDAQVGAWARESVYALKAAGYAQGNPAGQFQPLQALTRAEAVKLLHNIMGGLIHDASEHREVNGRNLVVNTAGGSLLGADLSGSLYLAPGLGEGDFAIGQSTIAGTVYVQGGGVHSITITDSTIGQLVIDRADGPVRVVIEGDSAIDAILIQSEEAQLELAEGVSVGQWELAVDSVLVNGKAKTSDTIGKPEEQEPGKETEPGSGNGTSSGGSYPGGYPGGGTVVTPETPKTTALYTYEQAQSQLANTGAEALVKQYLTFLADPTYTPALASPKAQMPDLVNAKTFVDYQFTVKPSIFPSMRDINSSVLNASRTTLWLGTDEGVTKVDLATTTMTPYTTAEKQLVDNRVLLLIDDGATGVYVITETGVSHIYH